MSRRAWPPHPVCVWGGGDHRWVESSLASIPLQMLQGEQLMLWYTHTTDVPCPFKGGGVFTVSIMVSPTHTHTPTQNSVRDAGMSCSVIPCTFTRMQRSYSVWLCNLDLFHQQPQCQSSTHNSISCTFDPLTVGSVSIRTQYELTSLPITHKPVVLTTSKDGINCTTTHKENTTKHKLFCSVIFLLILLNNHSNRGWKSKQKPYGSK